MQSWSFYCCWCCFRVGRPPAGARRPAPSNSSSWHTQTIFRFKTLAGYPPTLHTFVLMELVLCLKTCVSTKKCAMWLPFSAPEEGDDASWPGPRPSWQLALCLCTQATNQANTLNFTTHHQHNVRLLCLPACPLRECFLAVRRVVIHCSSIVIIIRPKKAPSPIQTPPTLHTITQPQDALPAWSVPSSPGVAWRSQAPHGP